MVLRLIVIVLAIAVLALAATFVVKQASHSRADLPVLGQLTHFDFVQQNGQPFGLSDFKGKLNVVDFIFTRCQGPCPIMSASMAELYRLYEGSEQVRFVSISVDPDYDTPEVFREYASRQGVTDDRWIFLNGPIEEVKRLSEEEFMLDAQTLPAGHATKFILVDDKGQIRSYYDSFDENDLSRLKTNIRELARQMP